MLCSGLTCLSYTRHIYSYTASWICNYTLIISAFSHPRSFPYRAMNADAGKIVHLFGDHPFNGR
jgi:hypothetical protein